MYSLTQTSPNEKMTLVSKKRHLKIYSNVVYNNKNEALKGGEVWRHNYYLPLTE